MDIASRFAGYQIRLRRYFRLEMCKNDKTMVLSSFSSVLLQNVRNRRERKEREREEKKKKKKKGALSHTLRIDRNYENVIRFLTLLPS